MRSQDASGGSPSEDLLSAPVARDRDAAAGDTVSIGSGESGSLPGTATNLYASSDSAASNGANAYVPTTSPVQNGGPLPPIAEHLSHAGSSESQSTRRPDSDSSLRDASS